MVAPDLVERDLGLAQLVCDAVAIGGSLRQLSIEMCLALSELVGRRGQCRVVLLLRIAQRRLDVGDLGREVCFTLRQAFNGGRGRLLVAPRPGRARLRFRATAA